MSVLTLAGIIAQARLLYADTDTVDPCISDANLTLLVNEKYLKWHEKVEQRFAFIDAATSGFKITTTSAISPASVTGTLTNLAEISKVRAYQGADATSEFGTTLERMDLERLLQKFEDDPSLDANGPTRYSLVRAETAVAADIGKWRLFVWPVPDVGAGNWNFPVYARKTPTILSGTATPDVSEEASYTIARLVAGEAAAIAGEDQDFIERILKPVPEDVMSSMGMSRIALKPHMTPAERAA